MKPQPIKPARSMLLTALTLMLTGAGLEQLFAPELHFYRGKGLVFLATLGSLIGLIAKIFFVIWNESQSILQRRLLQQALGWFAFAIIAILAAANFIYGLYVFFWFGLGGALTCFFFACLLRWEPRWLVVWIGVVALLHFVYVSFSFWQTSLDRAQRIDWIWFFPWNWMSVGGVIAAGAIYLIAKRANGLYQEGE
jgi:hypothetical protein